MRHPRRLKQFSLLLVLALALLLAACGGSSSEPPASEPTAQEDIIAETATEQPPAEESAPDVEATSPPAEEPAAQTVGVTVAVNAEFKPFVFMDEDGNLAGFDIDIMKALSAFGGFETGYVDRPFEGMLDALADGEYDAAISAITITDERAQKVNFTETYFETGQALMSFFSAGQGVAVRFDEMGIGGKDDLTAAVIVGVKRDTTGDEFVTNETESQAIRFDEAPATLQGLVSGEVDAVVLDIAVITDFVKANPGTVKIAGGPITEEKYGIAVNRERTDLLDTFNQALVEIRQNGTYDAIFDKWFGAP